VTLYTSDIKDTSDIKNTSDIKTHHANRQARRTAAIYLAISILCIIADKIYALFGHGVTSASMTLMFLYPLIGGLVPFLLLWLFVPRADNIRSYRFFYNCYNSGIAALTVQSMLNGVLEIAGTSSNYLIYMTFTGWLLTILGIIVFFVNALRRRL